jgi:hypothetical protein
MAVKSGRLVEIAVYGGSALVLTLADRVATRDVDAVIQNDAKWLRGAVAIVAEERGWPPDWLKRRMAVLESRPRTLDAVACGRRSGLSFERLLSEFLDEFYVAGRAQRQAAIDPEPTRVSAVTTPISRPSPSISRSGSNSTFPTGPRRRVGSSQLHFSQAVSKA